ncbi:MAG: VTT domain-containing protein [Bacilli bacterium]|nr:VTT domain-containing protein [Bacilli bacterium]MBQ2981831.1 VTT domain-containing protein [Lachnospiraceae bacterium]
MKIAKDYFIILGVIASSFVIFMLRNKFGVIEKYEYMAVFILCMLSNMTILLPAPSLVVIVYYAQILSPILVVLIGALGTTIGELTGYLFGESVSNISTKWKKIICTISKKIKKIHLLIFILAFLPLPIFDFIGVYAGSKRINIGSFLIMCYLGKMFKMLFYSVIVEDIVSKYISL